MSHEFWIHNEGVLFGERSFSFLYPLDDDQVGRRIKVLFDWIYWWGNVVFWASSAFTQNNITGPTDSSVRKKLQLLWVTDIFCLFSHTSLCFAHMILQPLSDQSLIIWVPLDRRRFLLMSDIITLSSKRRAGEWWYHRQMKDNKCICTHAVATPHMLPRQPECKYALCGPLLSFNFAAEKKNCRSWSRACRGMLCVVCMWLNTRAWTAARWRAWWYRSWPVKELCLEWIFLVSNRTLK